MDAEKTVAPKRGAKLKYLYAPPACTDHAIRKRGTYPHEDSFSGTKEELMALGLVPDGLFPGDPGMPLSAVVLWPVGTERGAGRRTPGKMRVLKHPSGKFCALLTVSAEEQERRLAQEEAENAARLAKWEAVDRLRKAERLACSSLHVIIQELGYAEVLEQVYRVRREQRPSRAAGHLRVVWSAPAP